MIGIEKDRPKPVGRGNLSGSFAGDPKPVGAKDAEFIISGNGDGVIVFIV